MTPNRLITIAIHTPRKAAPLKQLLERENIYAELNNVNLGAPAASPGVRIRIRESDLPLALRIIENIEIFDIPDDAESEKPQKGEILLPTDFSDHAHNALRLAFAIAAEFGMSVKLLYAYVAPTPIAGMQLADTPDSELADIQSAQVLEEESKKMMKEYSARIRQEIKTGEIPAATFSSEITEGIPEEAILDYARAHSPKLIVMGTRGADKKEAELIGSVTAEVLDSCRTPAFTVPENVSAESLMHINKVAFLCNLDEEDMIALDALYRLFAHLNLSVCLIHVPGHRDRLYSKNRMDVARDTLLDYCRAQFPRFSFEMRTLSLDSLIEDFKAIMQEATPFNLIAVPNKKRNVFVRVFNPSIAHKILFRADIPMMVIPV